MPAVTPQLASALELANLPLVDGVFPLQPGGKAPLADWHWKTENTLDPDLIRRWWGEHPTANIGVLSRCLRLDVDMHGHTGIDVLAALEYGLGELPTTPRVLTPTGGLHLYFAPITFASTDFHFADGVEVYDGQLDDDGLHRRYMLGPGSVTPAGAYGWAASGVACAAVPERWQEALRNRSAEVKVRSTKPTSGPATLNADGLIAGGHRRQELLSQGGVWRLVTEDRDRLVAAMWGLYELRCEHEPEPLPLSEIERLADSLMKKRALPWITDEVGFFAGIPPGPAAVLRVLCRRADNRTWVTKWMNQTMIGKEAGGIDRKTVGRATDWLVAAGRITIEEGETTHKYSVLPPE